MTDIRYLILHGKHEDTTDLICLRDRLTEQLNRDAEATENVTVVLARDAIRGPTGILPMEKYIEHVTGSDSAGKPTYNGFLIPTTTAKEIFVGRATADIIHRAWVRRRVHTVNVSTLRMNNVGAVAHTSSRDWNKWAKVTQCSNTERDQLATLNDTMVAGGSKND